MTSTVIDLRYGKRCIFIIIVLASLLFFIRNLFGGTCNIPQRLKKNFCTSNLPTIYAITPTYNRPVQEAELTRLSHVIMLSPNIHWILIEDGPKTSNVISMILDKSGLIERSTILAIPTPEKYKFKNNNPNWSKPRGVEQRNAGLNWLRNNVDPTKNGIVYFMDDDNTYSLELFEEMLLIESGRVAVWPVGLVGGLYVEKPNLNKNNKVIGFNSIWHPQRTFPIDMAGFAISIDLLFKYKEANFSYDVERGYQETEILRHLTLVENLQPLANFCTKVLVWHTKTMPPKLLVYENTNKTKIN